MKIWLFALLQSIVAVLGLAAYFLADNLVLATSAAVLAALLGIAQPLISAHKSRQLSAYRDQQYQKSIDTVDEHLRTELDNVIDPPLPHRPTVTVLLGQRFGNRASDLLTLYDQAVSAIAAGQSAAQNLASEFSSQTSSMALGPYLCGLAALKTGDTETAHNHFRNATHAQSSWVAPWLGWAATAYRLGLLDEIRQQHPHMNGVEMLPYDAGDESTFLQITEDERAELSDQFGEAATSLGSYYAACELARSKQQIAESQQELKRVA